MSFHSAGSNEIVNIKDVDCSVTNPTKFNVWGGRLKKRVDIVVPLCYVFSIFKFF
jgi:hypothetical protein